MSTVDDGHVRHFILAFFPISVGARDISSLSEDSVSPGRHADRPARRCCYYRKVGQEQAEAAVA